MYSKKGNYNPVSMETIIEKQLSQHFLTINLILSCLHIGVTFGRQSALFLIQKDWKMFGAARLMNLSKAFEYLPHDLLFLNIENYALNQFFICLCIHKGLYVNLRSLMSLNNVTFLWLQPLNPRKKIVYHISWFSSHTMQEKPPNFQTITMGNKSH